MNVVDVGNPAGVLTPVGAYTTSTSYYGTFDQGGLLWEWTEATYPNSTVGPNRIVRGVLGARRYAAAQNDSS